MKKFFALVLALVLTMGLCSVSLPASADDTPVELIVWLLGPGEQVDQPEVFELFNEKLHETLPNISVDITIFGSANEHRDSFARAMAAGERIDLCWMGYKHTIADQARDGNIIALDDLLNEYGQGIIETLGEDTIDLHRLSDGKIYNLISWQGLIGNRMGVFIPEESIENSGVGDTWLEEAQAIAYEFQSNHTVEVQQKFFDKFAEYLQGLVDNGKIYKGMNQYTFQQLQISGWFEGEWLAFGDRYTDSFAAYCTMEDDLVKNYFKNQAEYYDKGYIRSDIATADVNTDWSNGLDEDDEVATGHNAWVDNYDQVLTEAYGIPMKVIYNRKDADITLGNATSMVIPYTSEYPEQAMTFLNEIYTNAPLYQLLIYGEEGKHYTVNDDDSITILGGSGDASTDFAYGLWNWVIGTCENVRKSQNPYNNPAYYEELKAMEANAFVSPLLEFSYDKSNVEAEYANLSAVFTEYYPPLVAGYLGSAGWEAYYNEALDQMKANGLDTVLADCQEQLDAFCSERGITSWNWTVE